MHEEYFSLTACCTIACTKKIGGSSTSEVQFTAMVVVRVTTFARGVTMQFFTVCRSHVNANNLQLSDLALIKSSCTITLLRRYIMTVYIWTQ